MSSKNIWLFADVDDSLITSGRTAPEPNCEAAAFDMEGLPVGWLTVKQRQFLDLVKDRCHIVATTARTTRGVSTAQLRLGVEGYAICSFGGVILHPDGQVDANWKAEIEGLSHANAKVLEELRELVVAVANQTGNDVRTHVSTDLGMPLYLSVKHNQRNAEALKLMSYTVQGAVLPGWTVHLNGNFLAVLPPYVGKAQALRWFRKNIAGDKALAIGFGDSLTDLPFMQECDLALTPTNSQNFAVLLKEVLS